MGIKKKKFASCVERSGRRKDLSALCCQKGRKDGERTPEGGSNVKIWTLTAIKNKRRRKRKRRRKTLPA